MGFAIAYAYSNFLCISIKVYLLIAYLTIGIVCYCLIEIRLRVSQNTSIKQSIQTESQKTTL